MRSIAFILIFLFFCCINTVSGDVLGSGSFTQNYPISEDFIISATYQGTLPALNTIHFQDAAAVNDIDYLVCVTPFSKLTGIDEPQEWYDVSYNISSDEVGTGTFGYSQDDAGYVHIIAFFDSVFDLDGYSGAQDVNIIGLPSDMIRSHYWNDVSGSTKVYFDMGGVDLGLLGNYSYSYDFSVENPYVYGVESSKYYLDVTRPAGQSSRLIIQNDERTIVNETSIQTADKSYFDYNKSCTHWDIDFIDINGYVENYDLYFTDIGPPMEDSIEWGASSYVVDDTGSYSWSLSDDNWDTWLYSKKASIYRDETMVHEVSLPAQNGTFFYTFEEEGSFTVKLRHTSALLPHETLDTDTVNVIQIGDSYIHVNNTIVVGQHFDINFSYGFTPGNFLVNGVRAKYFHEDSNEWLLEKQWTVSDLYPITANTIYQVSGTHKVAFEGNYIFELYDFSKGVVATTPVITSISSSTTPTLNISTSYINISKTDYVMGEIMDGFYGIDNDNFTFNNYLVVYNYQYDTTSMDFPLTEQTSGFYGTIVQTDIHGDWLHGGEIPAIPGNNKISVYAENSTTRFEVVHVNFTVSAYDEDGYGLQLSSYDACINEEVLITVISPTDANLTIFSPTGMPIKTYTLNGSTTIKYWFPTSGMYSLELYKSGEGISRATATIYISDCAEDGIIEPPSGEMDDMYLNMFNVMTLPAFWGMIIFIGFIGGLAIKRDKNGDALVSGNGLAFIAFGLLNLLSIIGLFAPYTFYIIVSTWIFAGMFFGVGKYLARGEG